MKNAAEFVNYAPQEKVYLHTDKPYYSAGETIWFKAYLLNATTHFLNARSQFVYVELISQAEELIERIKIRKDSTGFSGYINLEPQFLPGKYVLRAYTNWMRNQPEDYFFKKEIYIGNDIDDRVSCQAVYGSYNDGKVPLTLTFTNTFHNALSNEDVKIKKAWEKVSKNDRPLATNKNGEIKLELDIPEDLSERWLEVEINKPGLNFTQKIYFPEFENDFDVCFFPESGVFLNNDMQTIAFKAIANDGLSVNVTGRIFNNRGEEVREFSSIHNGMGKISLQTQPGLSYYALIKTEKGLEKRFELPATNEQGAALQLLFNRKGEVMYQLINKTSTPMENLFLLIHSRGIVHYIIPLQNGGGRITEDALPEGILSFSVIDTDRNIYCERLYFSRNFKDAVCTMMPDKRFYGKRDSVSLNFQVLTSDGEPFEGEFSLSVTDSRHVKIDSVADNIKSYLLMTSDLQGYIEQPGSYFVDNSVLTRQKTDLLMLTQGWRKFETQDLVRGNVSQPEYFLEVGQTISGKVTNIANKPAKDNEVYFISTHDDSFSFTKTDSLGCFLFEGVSFPDSSFIMLRAIPKVKLINVELIPDEENYPAPTVFVPNRPEDETEAPDEYFQFIKEKYYNEGGMLIIGLDEITVKGSLRPQENYNIYSSLADNTVGSDRIEEMPGATIAMILSTMPGVILEGRTVSIRGQGTPLFLLDGTEVEFDEITYLNTFDIDEIALIKGAGTSFFGTRGRNGVISITLKQGARGRKSPPLNIATIMPLGYQKAAEFYVPKYGVDSVRLQQQADLRTTIYWDSNLLSDETGKINTGFYTADKPHNYHVILEGVSKDGKVCRFTDIIRREN